MAIYKKGSDPVALRASAERVTSWSRDLDGIRGDAGTAVRALKGQWAGGDLDRFIASWPRTDSSLAGCLTSFDAMATALRRNAASQDDASGGGSSFAANPGVGGGDGGGGDRDPDNPIGDEDLGAYVPIGAIPLTDEDLELEDINQGSIGDCWILAALGPIAASDPDFIRDHISYDADAGTYTVTLYDDGEPVDVTVDASVIEGGARDADGNANFASIYEKAMASFHGGTYDDIDGGHSDDAFETITGRDADSGDQSSFEDIQAGLDEGRIYAVGTEDKPGTWFAKEVEDDRIVANHAYMVAGIEERDGVQMIHLINPWGPGDHDQSDGTNKIGEIWLTEDQYHDSFDSTYSVAGGDEG